MDDYEKMKKAVQKKSWERKKSLSCVEETNGS